MTFGVNCVILFKFQVKWTVQSGTYIIVIIKLIPMISKRDEHLKLIYSVPEKQHALLCEKENCADVEKNDKKDKDDGNYLQSPRLQAIEIKNEKEKLKAEKISDDLRNSKDSSKKYNFLHRAMKRWTRKPDNEKKEYVPITETVSLPSLVGLDTLDTSVNSVEKKQKTKFINKYMKKERLKKVLVKS